MKVAIYSILAAFILLIGLTALLATSSYKRDVKHTEATQPITNTAIEMPDHSKVWRIEPEGYTCFVTSQAKAIWCDKKIN